VPTFTILQMKKNWKKISFILDSRKLIPYLIWQMLLKSKFSLRLFMEITFLWKSQFCWGRWNNLWPLVGMMMNCWQVCSNPFLKNGINVLLKLFQPIINPVIKALNLNDNTTTQVLTMHNNPLHFNYPWFYINTTQQTKYQYLNKLTYLDINLRHDYSKCQLIP